MKRSNGHVPATSFGSLVDRLFQDNVSRILKDDTWGFDGVNHKVTVPVNMRETDKGYELELVAPGLQKEDFKINVSGDLLTISYEHKTSHEQENKQEGWLRREYSTQSFSRSFGIDDTVDANKITASYKDGLLHLDVPKKEGAQKISRTIEIK
jgi:HSP20 family protein